MMTAVAQALSRVSPSAAEVEILKEIAVFCGAGLLVALMMLTSGLDMSPGLF
jgi:hypothetical protein